MLLLLGPFISRDERCDAPDFEAKATEQPPPENEWERICGPDITDIDRTPSTEPDFDPTRLPPGDPLKKEVKVENGVTACVHDTDSGTLKALKQSHGMSAPPRSALKRTLAGGRFGYRYWLGQGQESRVRRIGSRDQGSHLQQHPSRRRRSQPERRSRRCSGIGLAGQPSTLRRRWSLQNYTQRCIDKTCTGQGTVRGRCRRYGAGRADLPGHGRYAPLQWPLSGPHRSRDHLAYPEPATRRQPGRRRATR